MKVKWIFLGVLCIVFACKKESKKDTNTEVEKEVVYQSFGAAISEEDALSVSDMVRYYSELKPGDSVLVKFKGNIDEVCQKKGCWMTIPLDQQQSIMVRFKDYGFFVPMNAQQHEAILEGKVFIRETSVEELKHYAKDAGKSESELAKITVPKRELAFEASGVLIKE